MSKIEILAPAGGMDSVIAAVRSGADAVYVGAKQFSARASAHNFDEAELCECVRFCHRRGVKVHLAINTLIFDEEMENALNLVKAAAKADVDALIIQDMGLVQLVKKAVPKLPLHASTQLTVHTPHGAKALYELGFERVVLSRELSLSEIQEIHDFCPEVELEVFVHGALCMCLSGQCYFSAMLGGRSANRGMCAQPCRLPMKLGENDHALSLKDNGSLHFLKQLQDMGIASAKIEGRMKRPEYVAAATLAAREARDLGFITEPTANRLRSVFSRTGFTDGYMSGQLGEEMFGFRQKSDVVTADSRLFKEIHTYYKNEYQRIPLTLSLEAEVGKPMTLTASDGANTVTVSGEKPVEKAVNVPLSEEKALKSLSKTGGTPYKTEKIDLHISTDAAASVAELNALRRLALEKLGSLCEICHNYQINDIDISLLLSDKEETSDFDRAIVKNLDIPDSFLEFQDIFADIFAFDDEEKLNNLLKMGVDLGVEVPRATFGNEKEIYRRLKELKALGVDNLLAHNIAALHMGKELGYNIHAGFGLNICNSYTLMWAKNYGVCTAELSIELDIDRIEKLKKCIPVGVVCYAYLPLMITRNVPSGVIFDKNKGKNQNKTAKSFDKKAGLNDRNSIKSCKDKLFLQDRKNEKFAVIPREGYTEIYNCVPLVLPQSENKFGYKVFNIFRFNVENSVDNKENILKKYRSNRGFERKTYGLYNRGVTKFTNS